MISSRAARARVTWAWVTRGESIRVGATWAGAVWAEEDRIGTTRIGATWAEAIQVRKTRAGNLSRTKIVFVNIENNQKYVIFCI